MYSSMIFILGIFFQVVDSQTNVLWSTPQTTGSGLTKLCQKAIPMSRISRTFLCQLLPAMNIDLEWDQNNNDQNEQAQFNSHLIESPIIDNPEFGTDFKDFPFESPLYYSVAPNDGIPETLPLKTVNTFPKKYSNIIKSNSFEDINQFDSSEQIENYFNTFGAKRLIESPLLINDNMLSNHKINKTISKWPSIQPPYSEDFSSFYKYDRNIKTDSSVKNNFDKNNGNYRNQWNGWTPFYTNTDKQMEIKNNDKIEEEKPSSKGPFSLSRPYSSQKSRAFPPSYPTSTTTSSPIITIPSYIKRKYLLDLSQDIQHINPRKLSEIFENSTKSLSKTLNNRPNVQTFKDWSNKLTNQTKNRSNNWFPQKSEKKTDLLNKPKNEIIVQKFHTNYTKSSVIYSIEDSFRDKIRTNPLNEMNLNRIEVKTTSKITKNDFNSETKGKPGIDYPIYSSSVWSNFTCKEPGYFADIHFGCQVYHHCQQLDYHQKFICPNGTLFNIRVESCDYWFNVKCDHNSKKDLLISDFKTQLNKSLKSEDFLKDKPKKSQIMDEIKVFVENISKSNH